MGRCAISVRAQTRENSSSPASGHVTANEGLPGKAVAAARLRKIIRADSIVRPRRTVVPEVPQRSIDMHSMTAYTQAIRGEEMANIMRTEPALFHILPSTPVGMARLASESTHADDGYQIEFKAMQARSILNKSVSKRYLSLAWSINPFRGCEFGCKYCYARYTHEFLQPGKVAEIPSGRYDGPVQAWAEAFEHEIYLKENAAW